MKKKNFIASMVIFSAFALILSTVIYVKSSWASNCYQADTTLAIKECLNKEFNTADKELNAVYKRLMAHEDKEGKEKLKIAQVAWLKYRDANAAFSADSMRGGSGAGVAYLSTLIEMTKSRTKELKAFLKPYLG